MKELESLQERLKQFASERDWHQFHNARSLTMALTVEAAELMEHFQWTPDSEASDLSPDKREAVEMEMADVFLYLLLLANNLEVDLLKCADKKIQLNGKKYPVDKAYGSSKKYTEFE